MGGGGRRGREGEGGGRGEGGGGKEGAINELYHPAFKNEVRSSLFKVKN